MPVPAPPNKSWPCFTIALCAIAVLVFLLRATGPHLSPGPSSVAPVPRQTSSNRAGESTTDVPASTSATRFRRGTAGVPSREKILAAWMHRWNGDPLLPSAGDRPEEDSKELAEIYAKSDPREGFSLILATESGVGWIPCFAASLAKERPDDWFEHLSILDSSPDLRKMFVDIAIATIAKTDIDKAWSQSKILPPEPEMSLALVGVLATADPEGFFGIVTRENSRPLYLAYFEAPTTEPGGTLARARSIPDAGLSFDCMEALGRSLSIKKGPLSDLITFSTGPDSSPATSDRLVSKLTTRFLGDPVRAATFFTGSDLPPATSDRLVSNLTATFYDDPVRAATLIPYIRDPALRETTLGLLRYRAAKYAPDTLAEIHRIAHAPPEPE